MSLLHPRITSIQTKISLFFFEQFSTNSPVPGVSKICGGGEFVGSKYTKRENILIEPIARNFCSDSFFFPRETTFFCFGSSNYFEKTPLLTALLRLRKLIKKQSRVPRRYVPVKNTAYRLEISLGIILPQHRMTLVAVTSTPKLCLP